MNEITFKDFGEKGNWIGGCDAASASSQNLDVTTPYWGKKIALIPLSVGDDLDAAVKAASKAWPAWRDTPVGTRTQVMFQLKSLMERDYKELAELVALENRQNHTGSKREHRPWYRCNRIRHLFHKRPER